MFVTSGKRSDLAALNYGDFTSIWKANLAILLTTAAATETEITLERCQSAETRARAAWQSCGKVWDKNSF